MGTLQGRTIFYQRLNNVAFFHMTDFWICFVCWDKTPQDKLMLVDFHHRDNREYPHMSNLKHLSGSGEKSYIDLLIYSELAQEQPAFF